MPLIAAGKGSVAATARWLHGLWEYYREYTHTAILTASAAALTAFGLLIFIDRLFVLLAIAAYICPPLILYSLDADAGKTPSSSESATDRADSRTSSGAGMDSDDGDSDSDSDDGDADSDGTDADADADDGDSDTDG
ncbi:hypothetical protein [Natronomonas salina]|uniref:hypothetical protein n=1 Tax=Natronomonas salina TaxID=1710540 RepID=UPI001BAA28D6|nr:hypothetical protein [Natronomonas salina]